MSASALFSQYLLPQAAVSPGRLVINVNEPHQDFHDPSLDPKPYIIEQFLNQYDGTKSSTDQSVFASELTSILSSWFSKHAKASVRVTSDQIKTVYLINTGEWFRNAMKPEATRKWVERTIDEGEDMYLITGYHSLLDARIMEHTGEQRDSGGKLVLPVSEALAASGVVIAMGNIVDPGFTASSIRAEGGQREFVAKGEQICAVQYRKIRYRWFSKKSLGTIKLDKGTQWERYDRPRALESDGNDMIELELEDGITVEDGRNAFKTISGEIFIPVSD